MDSDEDTQMVDAEPLSSLAKGKARAVDRVQPYDNDNLPWYAI